MWLTPDRVLYLGLLGVPTVRSMGSLNVYVASEGRLHLRLDGGDWCSGAVAVVPPYRRHQVATDARLILALKIEAETVNLQALPAPLLCSGVTDAPGFEQRVRQVASTLCHRQALDNLATADFDQLLFGHALAARTMDARIALVVNAIKCNPAAALSAEHHARSVHLSFSRFLHLFRQEVGAPFRSFRTWKRARSLLQHVNRDANLAHVALDTGYPDSTHFSHCIRQVYGLKPRDIFAGSRRLAIYGPAVQVA